MMKTVIFKLKSGGRVGQETREQKLQEAKKYVKTLKEDGLKVETQEFDNHIEIKYEPIRNTTTTDSTKN